MRAIIILCSLLLAAAAAPPSQDVVTQRIYPAPRAPLTLVGLPEGVETVEVLTADRLTLTGLAAPARTGMPTLLLFHGNGSSAADAVRWLEPAMARGYGVVAVEYRGYSANAGRPSERGLAADADAFMRLARSRAGAGPVWIVAHSLGGGVGLALSERSPPVVIVTIGTFTRLRDMVSGPVRAVVPDAYRNIDVAGRPGPPWFIIHGLADDVVPATQGQALHRAAAATGRPGAAFVIAGADHHPDGSLLADILDAVRNRPSSGPPSNEGLPAAVRVLPFQSD